MAKRGFEWLEWNCSRAKRRPPPDCRAFSFVGLGCCPLAVGDWPLPPAVAVSTAAQRLRAAREAVLVTGVSRSLLLPGPPHSALLARSAAGDGPPPCVLSPGEKEGKKRKHSLPALGIKANWLVTLFCFSRLFSWPIGQLPVGISPSFRLPSSRLIMG